MKIKKFFPDYVSVLRYLTLFAAFVFFNRLEPEVYPYSIAVLVAALSVGTSVIITPVLFICSFLVSGSVGLLASAGIAAALYVIITVIYRKTGLKCGLSFAAYSILAVAGFAVLGDTVNFIALEKRILSSILTVALSFACIIAGKAITEKGLKFKLGFEEVAAVAVAAALLGTGISNAVSPYLWKGISIFIVLAVCYFYRAGTGTLVSAALGVSLAIYYNDVVYISVFLVWAIAAESLSPLSRYLSAVAVVAADYLVQAVFGVYGGYMLADFISVLAGAAAFSVIPTKLLKRLKDKLFAFRERQLVRQSINRNRQMISNRLYELSGVFTEMAEAFNLFKKGALTDDKAKDAIEKQILSSVCRECDNYPRCSRSVKIISSALTKMTDIGFAKGKLSLIDLPRELSEICVHPNNMLFSLNKLLADLRAYKIDSMNVASGRELIAAQASGVAEILRGLALESGSELKYRSSLEKNLGESLFRRGFSASEILIYGEDERLTVSLILTMKEFSPTELQAAVSKAVGSEMTLAEKANITEEKCYLSFVKAADFDAVFGVAREVKDGSDASGDTHSVIRISGDKFLVALSDGMGSGRDAQTVSSASLSLIESFYRAGLKSPLILGTVNKLLSVNTEDSFTALDITVIDLKDCSADFIKYGAPYGFIIGDGGIKIVEGNSLPLGIVDDLKPSVCHTPLGGGDMILLVTDGISDAFGSSGEIIDFLRTLPAKNPQTLANEILKKALELNSGIKKDDMTALAVRVFKRAS